MVQIPNSNENPISIIIGVSIECGAKASDNVITGGNNINADQNSFALANCSPNKIKNFKSKVLVHF